VGKRLLGEVSWHLVQMRTVTLQMRCPRIVQSIGLNNRDSTFRQTELLAAKEISRKIAPRE
jgi:hypothetical protein